MILGFLLLMGEAILRSTAARPHGSGPERLALLKAHMWLQLGAAVSYAGLDPKPSPTGSLLLYSSTLPTVCLILRNAGAFYAIYHNKDLHEKPHFKTNHGKVGLSTLILSLLSSMGGITSFKYLNIISCVPEEYHGLLKFAHGKVQYISWTNISC